MTQQPVSSLLLSFSVFASALAAGCQHDWGYNGFGEPDMYAAEADQYPFDPVAVDASGSGSGGAITEAEYSGTPAPLEGNSYTIQRGDTLWAIAARHYGDGQRWKDIQEANPGIQPNRMRIGQTIALP